MRMEDTGRNADICILLADSSFKVSCCSFMQAQMGAQTVVTCLFPGLSGTVLGHNAHPVHAIT